MDEERAVAMAGRLVRSARSHGFAESDAQLLRDAFAAVMDRRTTSIPDPAHPDYLHPARTALILLDDTGMTSVAALTAAMAYDSERTGLSGTAGLERTSAPAEAIYRQLPGGDLDDAALLETLVVASAEARDAAIAERLDHARHLHFGPTARWAPFHARVLSVWLPASTRAHPMLGRRFGRWAEAFEWRFLRSPVRRGS